MLLWWVEGEGWGEEVTLEGDGLQLGEEKSVDGGGGAFFPFPFLSLVVGTGLGWEGGEVERRESKVDEVWHRLKGLEGRR